MARIRSIKPEICKSETMARVTAEEERTFCRLWTECDDHGRARDHPRLLKAALFPLHDDVSTEDVDCHLDALADFGLIVRYEVDGKRWLAVPSWGEHQHPQKPTKSAIPPPPDDLPEPPRTRTRPLQKTQVEPAELTPDDRSTRTVREGSGPVVEWSGVVDGVERELGDGNNNSSQSDSRDGSEGEVGEAAQPSRLTPSERVRLVETAYAIIGQEIHDEAMADGKVHTSPDGHLNGCIAGAKADYAEKANALVSQHPEWSPEQLAHALTLNAVPFADSKNPTVIQDRQWRERVAADTAPAATSEQKQSAAELARANLQAAARGEFVEEVPA